jgi:hypothetical protein
MPVNSIFFKEQLDYVMNMVVREEFPELAMSNGMLVPITNQVDYRAETFSYTLMTAVGEAKILSNGGTDVPLVNNYVQKKMGIIRTLVDGYEITLEDLEAAQYAGVNISAELAITARRVIEEGLDRLGYLGASENGLLGLFTLPNVTRETAPNNGNVNGGTNSTRWINKTGEQIYGEITSFLTRMRQATRSIEKPEILMIPQAQYDRISELVFPANTDQTLLKFILETQRANPSGIKDIVPVEMLAGAGTGGTDLMIAYQKNASKIRYEIPLDFEQRPPQEVGFSNRVVCRARTGGIIPLKFMSVRYYEGI